MNGMVKNNAFQYQLIKGIPNKEELKHLLSLYTSIFEDAKTDFFKKRLNEKENVLSIIAFHKQKPIGFKIGYHYNKATFYSWVGGILPAYRKQGIAKELAKLQENWAKQQGYTKLRTKSMNNFKPMMILNLKNGFNIKQIYTNDSGQTKIVFEKGI